MISKFLLITLISLIPIGVFLLNWGLFLFGKLVWWIFSVNSPKLNLILIEIRNAGSEDFFYYETAIIILTLFIAIFEIILTAVL